MAVREASNGDLDDIDFLAAKMVDSHWRCSEQEDFDRPSRSTIAKWLSVEGHHGFEVLVLVEENAVVAAVAHLGSEVKWIIAEKDDKFISRLVAICKVITRKHGSCWGVVENSAAQNALVSEDHFVLETDKLVRFQPEVS